MSISAYFVSWPELVVEWNAHQHKPDFLYRAVDAGQPWVTPAYLWTDSPTTAMLASDVYEDLRDSLSPHLRKKFDELFGAFFWWNKADNRYTPAYVRELSETADPKAFAVTM
jgi:hypothetical protein